MKNTTKERIEEELNKPKYDLTTYQAFLILKLIEKVRREAIKEGMELERRIT